jgi:hypothetical protein
MIFTEYSDPLIPLSKPSSFNVSFFLYLAATLSFLFGKKGLQAAAFELLNPDSDGNSKLQPFLECLNREIEAPMGDATDAIHWAEVTHQDVGEILKYVYFPLLSVSSKFKNFRIRKANSNNLSLSEPKLELETL